MSKSYTSSPHCASIRVLWDCFTLYGMQYKQSRLHAVSLCVNCTTILGFTESYGVLLILRKLLVSPISLALFSKVLKIKKLLKLTDQNPEVTLCTVTCMRFPWLNNVSAVVTMA
jgi:hypothetical protein